MATVPDDVLTHMIAVQAHNVPAFLDQIAATLHKRTNFFTLPDWQTILVERFRAAATLPHPPQPLTTTSLSRMSLNSTTTSIPPSPEPELPAISQQSRHRPHRSRIADLLNVAHKPDYAWPNPTVVLASKTPEPDTSALLAVRSSVAGVGKNDDPARRYSFDIPETQAFPCGEDGGCDDGDETIPETQAFVPQPSRPQSGADDLSALDEQSSDGGFFQVDAADYVCTLTNTQSQLIAADDSLLLLDDGADAELSALQWNEPSVLGDDLGAAKTKSTTTTVTPDLDFGDNDDDDDGSGTATPDLSLEAEKEDEEDIFAMATQMFPGNLDKHDGRRTIQYDIDLDATQPFLGNKEPEDEARNDKFKVDLDATQPFLLHVDPDATVPFPCRVSTAAREDVPYNDNIFAMATQPFSAIKRITLIAAADDEDNGNDIYAQATQIMPPLKSKSTDNAEHLFAVPAQPDDATNKRRRVKKLTLAATDVAPPLQTPADDDDDDDAYNAATQPMNALSVAAIKIEVDVDDECYQLATQAIPVNDDDECYQLKTQVMPTITSINPPKPAYASPVVRLMRSAAASPNEETETNTPDFDYIRLADPRKILEAEHAFREKCRQQPHKKLLFADSSDEEDDDDGNALPTRRRHAAVAVLERATSKNKSSFVYKDPRREINPPLPPQPPSAKRSATPCPSTSAQNMTSTSESDTTLMQPHTEAKAAAAAAALAAKRSRKQPAEAGAKSAPVQIRTTSRRIAAKRGADADGNKRAVAAAPPKKRRSSMVNLTACDAVADATAAKENVAVAETGRRKVRGRPRKMPELVPEVVPERMIRTRTALQTSTNESEAATAANPRRKRADKSPHLKTTHTSKSAGSSTSSSSSSSSTSRSPSFSSTSRPRPNRTTSSTVLDSPSRSPKILFTVVDSAAYAACIDQLGGHIVCTPAECTVLVTNKVYRTYKFLSAMARGAAIVSESWLQVCARQQRFVPPDGFALLDETAEKRFKFVLAASLKVARERPVFARHSIYVTPSTKPLPSELEHIIGCAGGRCMQRMDESPRAGDTVIAVSAPEDREMWPQMRRTHPDLMIVNTEGVMLTVMQQRLMLKPYQLK